MGLHESWSPSRAAPRLLCQHHIGHVEEGSASAAAAPHAPLALLSLPEGGTPSLRWPRGAPRPLVLFMPSIMRERGAQETLSTEEFRRIVKEKADRRA